MKPGGRKILTSSPAAWSNVRRYACSQLESFGCPQEQDCCEGFFILRNYVEIRRNPPGNA
jgi:hypothetical protein